LFVKDLIFIDPEDGTRVGDFVDIFGRTLHVVWPDDKLGNVLPELKRGRSHIALVRNVVQDPSDDTKDPCYIIEGIITLEDIIEEILGDEIVDETDDFVDGTHQTRVDRAEKFKWARLRLLDSKLVDAHLRKNYPHIFQSKDSGDVRLERLISEAHVITLPPAKLDIGRPVDPDQLLYRKGVPTNVCTLILAGKITVLAGADNFRTDVSSWALLGGGALLDDNYEPDFMAYVNGVSVRCIQILREDFKGSTQKHDGTKKSTGASFGAFNTEVVEFDSSTYPSTAAVEAEPDTSVTTKAGITSVSTSNMLPIIISKTDDDTEAELLKPNNVPPSDTKRGFFGRLASGHNFQPSKDRQAPQSQT
jgi:hypothetical protein